MLTATLFVLTAVLIVLAGEAVRGQCRRLLDRPVLLVSAAPAAAPSETQG